MRKLRVLVAAVAAVALVGVSPVGAQAAGGDDPPVEVVLEGLDGPRGLQFIQDTAKFVVAESDTGEITYKNLATGEERLLEEGLPNPQGVDAIHGKLYIATGEVFEAAPDARGAPSSLLVGTPNSLRTLADLLAYELEHNPDEQVQFVDGEPVDSLSNPFSVLVDGPRVLVADAGANAVLSVHRSTGRVSTLFVPGVVMGGVCQDWPNNPGTQGCDPVPTGLAFGPDGSLYVSTLGAEAPGVAAVYQIDPHTGDVIRTIPGFTGAAGVAVGEDGTVYVSELLHNAPADPENPGPDFDPSTVGRIVRVAPDGTRTYAAVTMPSGLAMYDGELYASAWSVAGFLGMTGAGQVVKVAPSAFVAEDASS